MAKRNMLLAPFIRALKAEGWKQRYDSRSRRNGRIVEFFKFFGQREVQVQLWDDGLFRATHMLYKDKAKRRGEMNTSPTLFHDVTSMWRAAEYETRRPHPLVARVDSSAAPK